MRVCGSCGTDRRRHFRAPGGGRLCPTRPLNEAERLARGLPAKPVDGEPARFIVDHSLLVPEAHVGKRIGGVAADLIARIPGGRERSSTDRTPAHIADREQRRRRREGGRRGFRAAVSRFLRRTP